MPRSPSADKSAANPLLYVFMHTIVAAVRSDTTDLTARQLAVFLKAYLEPQTEHTVRGLAAELNVSKPAVTRALDRLANPISSSASRMRMTGAASLSGEPPLDRYTFEHSMAT